MFAIDMDSLQPVGEFGSRAWNEAVAAYGAKMLEAADLPADLSWGFSEHYTCPPERLVSDEWPQSGYHFMVPEFADVPTTDLGVPVFSRMSDGQKSEFLALCGVEVSADAANAS